MERTITPEKLQTLLAAGASITLIDVRRDDDREKKNRQPSPPLAG